MQVSYVKSNSFEVDLQSFFSIRTLFIKEARVSRYNVAFGNAIREPRRKSCLYYEETIFSIMLYWEKNLGAVFLNACHVCQKQRPDHASFLEKSYV